MILKKKQWLIGGGFVLILVGLNWFFEPFLADDFRSCESKVIESMASPSSYKRIKFIRGAQEQVTFEQARSRLYNYNSLAHPGVENSSHLSQNDKESILYGQWANLKGLEQSYEEHKKIPTLVRDVLLTFEGQNLMGVVLRKNAVCTFMRAYPEENWTPAENELEIFSIN